MPALTSEALQAAVVFAAWPGMAAVSAYAVWRTYRFYANVNKSVFGRLVLLMVTAWVAVMAGLGYLTTLLLWQGPATAPPVVVPVLMLWAGSMATIVWVVQRWGEEAVSINMYYLELRSMDSMKSQLINTVAHELNTPLTPVQLKLELLATGSFDPLTQRQQEAVDGIRRSFDRISGVVDQVVLCTQVQAGHLVLRPVPVDIDELVRRVAASFQEAAGKAQVTLEAHGASGAVLELDRQRMERVVAGLVENAIKFNRPGGQVQVQADRVGGQVQIRVSDTGVGLDSAGRHILFQPFRQAHDPQERTDSGAGLDLYIAKGIVEQHGGRIWAESPGAGQGATFAISLPVTNTTQAVLEAAPASG